MSRPADSQADRRFASVAAAPPDAILGLSEAFAADPNPAKMNLSVGVYKDASGQTPVLSCVKEAERRLIESESTKGYLPIDGLLSYRDHVHHLVFGELLSPERVTVLQTPGGTGALRVAADFLSTQLAPIRVWLPSPTWANHPAVFAAAGVPTESYRYLASDKTTLDWEGLIDDLRTKTQPGEAVLLHACCHNPTGADPSADQWRQLAAVLAERNLLPLIDFAYQGFGSGLHEDTTGVREVLTAVDEAIICSSFSKNFGLYSERAGALSLVAADASAATAAQTQLKRLARSNYSNPPLHGAAIVATVLDDAHLTELWRDELMAMRERIARLRILFVEGMKKTGVDRDFSFLLEQKGMFSFSGLTPMQVDELRNKHSIYVVGSGRINVAGMNESQMDQLCAAVADVLSDS